MTDLPVEEQIVGVLSGDYPNVLPPNKGTYWGYHSLAELLGEVVGTEDIGDYQGTTYFLLRRGARWGLLAQDYGSCSGCDWAEACTTYEEFAELFEAMKAAVQWFDDPSELVTHMRREYAPQHSWYGADYTKLVDAFVALLPPESVGAESADSASGSDEQEREGKKSS